MDFFVLFLSSDQPSSHRFKRIEEEIKKRGLRLVAVNLFKDFILTEKGIVNIKEGDFLDVPIESPVLIFSNNIESHLAIEEIVKGKKETKFSMWPNSKAIKLSNKFLTSLFFKNNRIATPPTVFLVDKENIEKQAKLVGGFPCVIKGVSGSEGNQVGLINSKKEAVDFIEKVIQKNFLSSGKRKIPSAPTLGFILQKYIKEAQKTDYRILCLEKEIIGGIKRTSQTDDFRSNVSLGGKAEKFDVPEKLGQICRKIMQKGNLFYAGIDFINDGSNWLAIEINTSAQFRGFESATGINVAGKLVDALIKKADQLFANT